MNGSVLLCNCARLLSAVLCGCFVYSCAVYEDFCTNETIVSIGARRVKGKDPAEPNRESNNGEPGECGKNMDNNNNKKIVSGKCTKPDETDIKIVVKYAHEKLDPKHVTHRKFETLNFCQLVAGELELIARPNISEGERMARVHIAKTICYHKQYLSDFELREGYDQLLKRVKTGAKAWSKKLGEQLHNFYDYRAMALMREKIQNNKTKITTAQGKESGDKVEKKSIQVKEKEGEEFKIVKPVFCMEYNQGTCKYDDTHEGYFGGKKTWKWHICR